MTIHAESNEPIFHGINPVGNGRGQVLFAAARFLRTLEETYARPGGRRPEGAPTWPYHTFDPDFRFAAEKFWDTVWKIERVAELIQGARCQIKDLQPPSVAAES